MLYIYIYTCVYIYIYIYIHIHILLYRRAPMTCHDSQADLSKPPSRLSLSLPRPQHCGRASVPAFFRF